MECVDLYEPSYNSLHSCASPTAVRAEVARRDRDTIGYMSDALRGIAYALYERVERERALRGWSATRLHTETGVSRSTIGKWATQTRPPLPATVNAVADALGIERAEALRLAGILTDLPAAGPDLTPQSGDPDSIRGLLADERLSPEDRIRWANWGRRLIAENTVRRNSSGGGHGA